MANFDELTEYLGTLLAQLSEAERRTLEMSIARKLRASQRIRITKQQNPDGSQYVPRKTVLRDNGVTDPRHVCAVRKQQAARLL